MTKKHHINNLENRNPATSNPSTINIGLTPPPQTYQFLSKDTIRGAPDIETHLCHVLHSYRNGVSVRIVPAGGGPGIICVAALVE